MSARVVNKGVEVDAAGVDPVGIEKFDPFFQRWNPVRDLSEVVFAHYLLIRKIKRGMIGGDGVDDPVAQSLPKDFLATCIPQRGRHHEFCAFKSAALSISLI